MRPASWSSNSWRAPQQADKEAVGLGAARRHLQALGRYNGSLGERISALAQRLGGFGGVFHGKFGVVADEIPNLVAILLRQHRAGDIGDTAAALDQRRGAVEQG